MIVHMRITVSYKYNPDNCNLIWNQRDVYYIVTRYTTQWSIDC